MLAYSADADTIVWSSGNAGVLRSQNQDTFAAVDSLPAGALVAADKRNNDVFYAAAGAAFFRSTDAGATFAEVAGALPAGGGAVTSIRDVVAHPAVEGEVWVSTDAGLFRSTDHGETFAPLPGGSSRLTATEQVAFGRGDADDAWNVYAFGVGAAGARLYASADGGATWVDIQGDQQGFGAMSANRVAGSGNVPGQVYVGTNGRGVFYAKVSVPPGGGGGGGGSSSSSSSSTAAPTRTTSTLPTTLTTSTVGSSSSSTSSAPTTTPPAERVKRYGQCGGRGWQGPTECEEPWTCTFQNEWYSQCL